MREDLIEIEYRLRKLGLPDRFVDLHLQETERWRKSHPQKIRRQRLWDDDPHPAAPPANQQKPSNPSKLI